MLEIFVLLSAFAGAVVGGAAVWRWTGERAPDGAPAPPAVGPAQLDALDHELERARRYERGFCLLRLVVPDEAAAADPTGREAHDFFESLRAIDVAWIDDEGITVLLPELGRAEGETCLHRLRGVAPELTVDTRLAVFPEDGLTRGALLATLATGQAPESRPAAEPAERFRLPGWAAS